jgi:prepilin-type N-terminal cleavage/methylation domain-containing protein
MRGYTLVELVFVLFLVGVATATAAPAAVRQRDRAMVVGAREAVVGLLAEARAAAVEAGGASVRLWASPGRAEAVVRGMARRTVHLEADFGVSVGLSGAAAEAELSYDGLGLGRVASQTITFRRGSEVAELVVSAYGRARRR